MSFAQLERSRQSGAICEIFRFRTSGGPSVGGNVFFRETWSYEDAVARDAVWEKTSECAAAYDGGATGGFAGDPLHVGVQFGCGLGAGGGYAKHTRTISGLPPSGNCTLICGPSSVNAIPGFLNFGISINGGAGEWISGNPLSGIIQVPFVANGSGEVTVSLGAFDLEFGMSPIVIYFGMIVITSGTGSVEPITLTQHYTSADVPIVYNGDTYEPAVFYRASPFTVGSGERRDIELAIPRDHVIAQQCFDGHPRGRITVDIFRIHRGNLTSVAKPLKGQVLKARFEDAKCVLTIGGLKSLLSQKKPSMLVQRHCPHKLYGSYCQAVEADFTHSLMFVEAVSGRNVRVQGSAAIAGEDDTYFTNGKLTLPNGQMEFIETQDGNDLTLQASLAGVEVGSIVILTAGCDKLATTCDNRFHNIIHFGGEPGMPRRDPYSGAGIVGTGG